MPNSFSARSCSQNQIEGCPDRPPSPTLHSIGLLAPFLRLSMCWSGWLRWGRCPERDRPDEGGEFARDGDRDDVPGPTGPLQAPVACTKSNLRLPADLPDRFGQIGAASQEVARDPCGQSIAPGAFHQYAPRPRVAGLGDIALRAGGAG